MRVRIKKTDTRLGVVEGEVYEAVPYGLDPDKVSLLRRIPDGYDPECNQYRHDIDVIPGTDPGADALRTYFVLKAHCDTEVVILNGRLQLQALTESLSEDQYDCAEITATADSAEILARMLNTDG